MNVEIHSFLLFLSIVFVGILFPHWNIRLKTSPPGDEALTRMSIRISVVVNLVLIGLLILAPGINSVIRDEILDTLGLYYLTCVCAGLLGSLMSAPIIYDNWGEHSIIKTIKVSIFHSLFWPVSLSHTFKDSIINWLENSKPYED